MDALQQQAEKVDLLVQKTNAFVDDAGGWDKLNADQVSEFQRLNEEINAEAKKRDEMRSLFEADKKNRDSQKSDKDGGNPYGFPGNDDVPGAPQAKSIGELFVGSPAYKAGLASGNKNFSVNLPGVNVKTTFSEGGTGFSPQVLRTGLVVPSAQQLPRLIDTIPATTTDMVGIKYMLETTYTNNAIETSEGGNYAEAALGYTEENQPVQKIGVFIPVTDEQLADVAGMQDRINNRLTLMMRQRLDKELVLGTGTAPNLLGLSNVSGIQTQARGTDPGPDAIYKAMVLVRSVGFAEPNALWMNPTDWQNIRLLKTADGLYIYGNPSQEVVPMLWGLPVIQSTYVTQGDAFTGDFATYSEIAYRAGLEFEISNSHASFFTQGLQAIRCQLRAAVVWYRNTAFCEVTGL